jgi:hypothetical protein
LPLDPKGRLKSLVSDILRVAKLDADAGRIVKRITNLTANPTFVIANGGVSAVTAILVEPAGTFVPDGTEVFFFTNLGGSMPAARPQRRRQGQLRV